MGCSTGGHQALTEVQRFPADYDGVVAGDPGNNRVHLNVGFLWAFAATHDVKGAAILPTSKLPLVNRAALAACDAADGVKDGIISDPQACHFDPGILLCKAEENNECLTTAQVEAVRKVYAGPRNPRTGERIIAGYAPGSESPAGDEWAGGWKGYITDRKEPMRLDFWKYWVFDNPDWDWRTFDYDRDVAYADEKLPAVIGEYGSERIQGARRKIAHVLEMGRSCRITDGRRRLLRASRCSNGRTSSDGLLLPALHGPGNDSLRRWTRSKLLRRLWAVRAEFVGD